MCVGVSVWLVWSGIRVAGFSLQHGYHLKRIQETDGHVSEGKHYKSNTKIFYLNHIKSFNKILSLPFICKHYNV